MESFTKVYEVVKSKLSEKRIFHSECVMERAVEFAKIYEADVEKARFIGIAHDVLKETPKELRIEEAEKLGCKLDDVEKSCLGLIHAKAGAEFCRKEFGFSDDMCSAISFHTTGRPNMTLLEKILYLADATGKDRTYEEAKIAYELAKNDLDEALLYFFKKEIEWNLEENKMIHVNTIDAYNYLVK